MSRSHGDFNKISGKNCPVCSSTGLVNFFEMFDVPVNCGILWKNREAAINCEKGDITLAFCPVCGLITNISFKQDIEYSQQYDSCLFHSSFYQNYARSQAMQLIERYDLYEKDIIEIGCGQGDFLLLLCELGNNRGVGFDPSYVRKDKDNCVKNDVRFIQDYYSEKYSGYEADFIVCRYVLEHVPHPRRFLQTVRAGIGEHLNTPLFFVLPNALNTFRKLFLWDIIYEHCSYFISKSALHTLLSSGFKVEKLSEDYEGQYLLIDALPAEGEFSGFKNNDNPEIRELEQDIITFSTKFLRRIGEWKISIEKMVQEDQRMVIWGAGTKGVAFLNLLKGSNIDYAVDLNPRKQGKYIPCTGQRIVSPKFLKDNPTDIIIVMNPIYENEIRGLAKRLGLQAKIISM